MLGLVKSPFASILLVCVVLFPISLEAQTTTTFLQTGQPEFFVVPSGVNTLHIEAWGAEGGHGTQPNGSFAGLGAHVAGDFNVTPGDTLVIIVGRRGKNSFNPVTAGGGGGGSFVIQQNGYVPMLIAGGGGGGSYMANSPGDGGHGDTTSGAGAYWPVMYGFGGFSDNSGGGGYGGGGSGWHEDGGSNNWTTPAQMQGGLGGESFWQPDPDSDGGYGGGGAGYHGGGGGGGYTGGSGGGYDIGGGGGGSYNAGFNKTGASGVNSGPGKVEITIDCIPMTTTISSPEVCDGEEVTILATSTVGGTVTWTGGVSNGTPFTPPVGTTTYTAISSNTLDCPFSTDILVHALPAVQASATDEEFCYGFETTVTGSGADTYVWDNGVTDGVAFMPPPGYSTYTVIGTDASTGCENTDSIVIMASQPTPSYVISPEQFGNDGAIDMTVNNALPPYAFDWNNDGTGDWDDPEDLTGLAGGSFTVNIMDYIGCTESGVATVESYLSMDEETVYYTLYPNPAHDFLMLSHPDSFQYSILDINGRLIMNGNGVDQTTIEVSDLSSGQYILVINAGDQRVSTKFVKE